jgi:hypothetical protein
MGERADFTWHDLRRSMRSGLSRLGVDERTAEMTIGYLPQGMIKTYDLHDRLAERRDAMERWALYVLGLIKDGIGSPRQTRPGPKRDLPPPAGNDNGVMHGKVGRVTLWGKLLFSGDQTKPD